ncbi:MarR family winged helix-turn-helix transcriptional regulator [Timonella senegalensis]|uniref:MarR family winged helix-turn-helix transcriptional regulator n=1 Tax=Timonella senegalensis TaxID=1465825 RepID=UPI002FDD9D2D
MEIKDEVDRIIAAWQVERPDLDVTPLAVLSRISRLDRHLDKSRRAAFAANHLEPWEFDVLSALRRAGEPYTLSPGALVTQTMVNSGSMPNSIDRLDGRALVIRRPSPDDRRAVLVELTDPGRELVDSAFHALLEIEHHVLEVLTDSDQHSLADMLRSLTRQFEQLS